MKRKLQIIFITLTLFGFALPIITFNKMGIISEREKRNLAVVPQIVKDGYFNRNLFSEYDTYLSDRFGGRQRLVSLNSKLNFDIFKAFVYNDNALRGKAGWWFYI